MTRPSKHKPKTQAQNTQLCCHGTLYVYICLNPNPLAGNLSESAKIQHHAVTQPPNCWTWLELGHLAPCKVSLSGLYSTESIKIQHHAVTLPPNCWTSPELGHPAPCKVSLSGLYSTESIKIQHHAVTLPPNCWT